MDEAKLNACLRGHDGYLASCSIDNSIIIWKPPQENEKDVGLDQMMVQQFQGFNQTQQWSHPMAVDEKYLITIEDIEFRDAWWVPWADVGKPKDTSDFGSFENLLICSPLSCIS